MNGTNVSGIDIGEYLRRLKLGQPVGGGMGESPQQPPQQSQIPPALAAYQKGISEEPMLSQYHPSKMRNILSGIAGVGTGLAEMGPAAASEAASQVRYAPFQQQMSQYQQMLDQKRRAAMLEGDIEKQRQAGILTGARVGELGARAKREEAQVGREGAMARYYEADGEKMETPEQRLARAQASFRPVNPPTHWSEKRGTLSTVLPGGTISTENFAPALPDKPYTDPKDLARLRASLSLGNAMALLREKHKLQMEGREDKPEKGISETAQKAAENLATRHLYEMMGSNPEFARYKDFIGIEKGQVFVKPPSTWVGEVTPDKQALFKEFLDLRNKLAEDINTKAKPKRYSGVTGGFAAGKKGDPYKIVEEPDEDESDDDEEEPQ